MWRTGAFSPFRLQHRREALILTYHRFGEQEGRISARALREQLDYLSEYYRFIALSELALRLDSSGSLPPGLVAITIDDGYRDAYEVAFPLLRDYRVPATIFVVTDFIDRQRWLWTDQTRYLTERTDRAHFEVAINGQTLRCELTDSRSRQESAALLNQELKRLPEAVKETLLEQIEERLGVTSPRQPPEEFRPLAWEEIREMADAGIEIGSHTASHPILTLESDQRLEDELELSRARIKAETGRVPLSFCYPNGDYNARVAALVARAGYRCAVTCEAGWNRPRTSLYELRRIHTEPDLPHFAQVTSGFEEVKKRLRSAVLSERRVTA